MVFDMPNPRITAFAVVLGLLLFVMSVNSTLAEVYPPPYNPEQLAAIQEARIRVSEIRSAEKDGDISAVAAERRVRRIMVLLNTGLTAKLTEGSLKAMTGQDTINKAAAAMKKQSFFAGVNFLRLGLIAVFTILAMLLIGRHLIYFVRNLPKEIWELGVYAGGVALLAAQGSGVMKPNQFSAFLGCLLIGGGLGLTLVIHRDFLRMDKMTLDEKITLGRRYLQQVCPAVMTVVFAAAALITGSVWIGGLAALSLMTLLGFSGAIIPFGYALGFRDHDALARGTSTGLLVVAVFMCLKAANFTHPLLRPFESGALVVGGIVGYLGLLIAGSNRYLKRLNWLAMQGLVLVLCFAGVLCASLLGISSVQIIAGSFLTLWTIEKLVEIPGNGFVPWVLKLMAASGALYLMVTYGAPIYARYLMA